MLEVLRKHLGGQYLACEAPGTRLTSRMRRVGLERRYFLAPFVSGASTQCVIVPIRAL